MSELEGERRAGLVAILIPLTAAVSIAALVALAQASDWLRPASRFHGRDVTPENWHAAFSLTDTAGLPVALADLRGKAVLVAFGYTHCRMPVPRPSPDLPRFGA